MEIIVSELNALQRDLAQRKPTIREKTAAAAFLAQFYSGIENILKRICLANDVTLPSGDTWHVELFQRFCAPGYASLPILFDEELAVSIAPYRRFRYVAFHSYGFQIQWKNMQEGVMHLQEAFDHFRASALAYLETL